MNNVIKFPTLTEVERQRRLLEKQNKIIEKQNKLIEKLKRKELIHLPLHVLAAEAAHLKM